MINLYAKQYLIAAAIFAMIIVLIGGAGTLYCHHIRKSELTLLKNPALKDSVEYILIDNFTDYPNRKIRIEDKKEIASIATAINKAKPRFIESREGMLKYCSIHLRLNSYEEITMKLSKDNRSFTNIDYAPDAFPILKEQTPYFNSLFE